CCREVNGVFGQSERHILGKDAFPDRCPPVTIMIWALIYFSVGLYRCYANLAKKQSMMKRFVYLHQKEK
ncbi:MAG: hypothetical protein K2F62_05990, partial [Muribaculaceae bacterium]|nr:hypothetical protein [Muribaculaceae bacterium]